MDLILENVNTVTFSYKEFKHLKSSTITFFMNYFSNDNLFKMTSIYITKVSSGIQMDYVLNVKKALVQVSLAPIC